jgi:small ligand-binding sensory domain FIST
MKQVATGLAIGHVLDPALAADAVNKAMQQLEITTANAVILFLTSEFASDPLPAIRAAAKAASCTQVIGCSAPGIFTQEDWVLDAPAVAAMVFSRNISLQPLANANNEANTFILALTAPNAINANWITAPGQRYGGVSGDVIGQGPFSVWQNAKGVAEGHTQTLINGVKIEVGTSHGLHILSEPQLITETNEHDLIQLADQPALTVLEDVYQQYTKQSEEALPLHLLMAITADTVADIQAGHYQLSTIVSGNEEDASVTLAKMPQTGQYLSWGLREADAAQADLKLTAEHLVSDLNAEPDFGMLFSCLGRGPYFYDGIDRDLAVLKQRFPDMPLIGFYGNGEIAPINGVNELLQYSAVLALFAAKDEEAN